ncbi:MAG: translation initiation inhibitor [Bacteroidales bacterium]|nr:translation initiation inhibitor [Bacteroidales bacterium]
MDNYKIIKPEVADDFAGALESVVRQMGEFLTTEEVAGRSPVYVRFFLSDAQNQAAALREALRTGNARTGGPLWVTDGPFARRGGNSISIVEQPPLDGNRIAALVRTSSEADQYLFHSLRLTEEEAAGKTSYEQSRLLFDKYLGIIRPLGLELKTHCVRTWIYVRDIDSNYAGLVKARNDVFAEEGLSFDTHYIASTGIGGANECRSAVVAIDFLTQPGICEADKTYLKALSHLSPTHDYGVAFERGVKVAGPSADHIYISGTASIDHLGHILHEGDVIAQADRLLENIAALLAESGRDGLLSAKSKGPVRVPQGEPGTGIAFPHCALAPVPAGVPY